MMVYDEIKTRAMFIKASDRIKHPVVTLYRRVRSESRQENIVCGARQASER